MSANLQRASNRRDSLLAKNTICLWYDKDAEAAARFYAAIFPDSAVGAIHRAPSDYPSGKTGDVLVAEFTVAGVPCVGLNCGPAFKHTKPSPSRSRLTIKTRPIDTGTPSSAMAGRKARRGAVDISPSPAKADSTRHDSR